MSQQSALKKKEEDTSIRVEELGEIYFQSERTYEQGEIF
jgi:hypothetical protein